MRTCYILDLYMWIYTSFYAHMGTELTSPSGEPTTATYVFVKTLLKLIRDYQPDMLCVASDCPEKTFRKEMYKDYKAGRPDSMPDGIITQIKRIKQILKIMRIPIYEVPGFEADDIIGTVTKLITEQFPDVHVSLCTRDKDVLQLLNDRVTVLDINKNRRTNLEDVEKKWGIPSKYFRDFLALQGDASDHVPGVKGIGLKAAVELLNDWGDIDTIYQHLDDLKQGTAKKLQENKEMCYLSRALVTICQDVPIKLDVENMLKETQENANLKNLDEVFQELGFTSLIREPRSNTGRRLF